MADTLAAALGEKQMSPASVQQVLLAHPDPREASSVLLSSQP
jgi:hypothetical protein